MEVSLKEYQGKMNPEGRFWLHVEATHLESKRRYFEDAKFELQKPNIDIVVKDL